MPGLRRLPLLAAVLLAVVMAVPVSAAAPAKPDLHALGFVKTPVTAGIKTHGNDLMTAYAVTPESVDLSAWAPPVGNQGAVGSCTSWATGWGMRYWFRNHVLGETTTFAPMYLYAQIVKGSNVGTSFPSNFNLLLSQGIAPASAYATTNAAYYDYTTQPTSAQKAAAVPYKATSYSMLFSGANASNADTIKAAMAAGQPVVVAIPVYPEFDNVSAANGWLVTSPLPGESSRGGHALFAPKYDANGLWIENSWGAGWGNAGWANLSWDFLNTYAWEAWTMSTSTTDVNTTVTTISSFAPSSGAVGTNVTITGKNFTGATEVAFNGTPATVSSLTDTQIVAAVPAGATSGYITVTAPAGSASSATAFTVTKPATTLAYTGTKSTAPSAPVTLSATLAASGTPLAGRTVTFTLSGKSYPVTTDAAGIASAGATAPATGGSYAVGVSFAGDATYAASSTSATLVVSKPATAITYTGPTQVTHSTSAVLGAYLRNGAGAGIASQTLTFTVGSKKLTARTDATGYAKVTWTASRSTGSVSLKVAYAGSTSYASSSVSLTLKVV